MTPARRLRGFRNRFGLSQKRAADLLETGQQSVSEIERGLRPPPPRLVRLIDAYEGGFRPKDWPDTPDSE